METHAPVLPIIDVKSFDQTIESHSVVVILAWVFWDPAGRRFDLWLRQACDSYKNLHFYAMDIDQEQNWPFAVEWGMMTTPTLICIFNSVFHEKQVGLGPEPQISAKLSEWNSLGGK